jgi:hypothetical protein
MTHNTLSRGGTGPGRPLDAGETPAVPGKCRGIRRHALRDEFGVYRAFARPAFHRKTKGRTSHLFRRDFFNSVSISIYLCIIVYYNIVVLFDYSVNIRLFR